MFANSYGSSLQPTSATFQPAGPLAGLRIQQKQWEGNLPGVDSVRLPLTQKVITLTGLAVLALLAALPLSDAVMLLRDFNYTFWSGQAMPIAMIFSLLCVLLVFCFVSGGDNFSLYRLATLVSTFTTLMGLILVLSALCLFDTEQRISIALRNNCGGSMITRDAGNYYQRLLVLRKTSACAKIYSIEDCDGFADAAPPRFAQYFQSLETDYRCSGFCHQHPSDQSSSKKANASSLVQVSSEHRHSSIFLGKGGDFVQAAASQSHSLARAHRASSLPPALFSQATFKTSCDGAAGRNLHYMALGTAKVWWWMAMVLIGLAVITGIGEWMSSRKV